ncbi:MAG: DinB family protein [Chloroflexi bacterium]|nr:DinB family protein [Chloroflexota bacterium]
MSEELTFATTRLGLLLDQYDTSYAMLRERLDGITDAEYFWEPVAHGWSVRRRAEATTTARGKGEWVFENDGTDPTPAPFTTIAWRLCHVVAGQMTRCDYTFGTKSLSENEIEFPGSAAEALAFLESSHQAWRAGLATLTDADLDVVGLSSYPDGLDTQLPFGPLLWWTNRELIHHGGEIGLLRDLWQFRSQLTKEDQ